MMEIPRVPKTLLLCLRRVLSDLTDSGRLVVGGGDARRSVLLLEDESDVGVRSFFVLSLAHQVPIHFPKAGRSAAGAGLPSASLVDRLLAGLLETMETDIASLLIADE